MRKYHSGTQLELYLFLLSIPPNLVRFFCNFDLNAYKIRTYDNKKIALRLVRFCVILCNKDWFL